MICSSLTSSRLPPATLRLPAVVLLFLLEVAFCQENRYNWAGPGESTGGVDPNTENGEFRHLVDTFF